MNPAAFLLPLSRASLHGAVLVLLVIGVQWLLRKRLSPRWRCALWLIVLVRLIPFSVTSAVSMFNLVPRYPARERVLMTPAAVPAGAMAPAANERRAVATAAAETMAAPGRKDDSPHSLAVVTPTPRRFTLSAVQWRFIAWLAGAVGIAIWVAGLATSTARRLRSAARVRNVEAEVILRAACVRLGVRRVPVLFESGHIMSPAVYGLFRPRLLLPVGFLSTFSPDEWRHVFLHEIAHIRRRDLWLNWVFTAMQVVHWFNPFVWYAYARWRLDRELACDALALEAAGGEDANREYGRTMLRLLEGGTRAVALPTAIGIAEDKRQLKRRLSMIIDFVPAGRWSAAALLVVLGLGAVGLTDAQEKSVNAPSQSVRTNTLTLTVLGEQGGKPVAGAKVLVYGLTDRFEPEKGSGQFTTDERGMAEISVPIDVPMAAMIQTFQIAVRHAGYGGRDVMWISKDGNVRATLPDRLTVHLGATRRIGGIVRDEMDMPLAGATVAVSGNDYRGFVTRRADSGTEVQEYPAYSSEIPATTAADGRWTIADVPADLEHIIITVTRPDGAVSRFETPDESLVSGASSPILSLEQVRSESAVLTLGRGRTVRGRVVDDLGRAVPGATVKVRDVNLRMRFAAQTKTSDAQGRFELAHWTGDRVVCLVSKDGFADSPATTDVSGELVLKLAPPRPLKLRVVDVSGQPLKARVAVDPFRSAEGVGDWRGMTDADGRLAWANAPTVPLVVGVYVEGCPPRTVHVKPDGSEQVVRLRQGTDQKVAVELSVVDAATGAPVPRFEVWRRMNQVALWSAASDGHFLGQLDAAEFPKGWTRDFGLEIRATGYTTWTSDRLAFEDGDQKIGVRLAKGVAGAPVPLRFGGSRQPTLTLENEPTLRVLGDAAVRLLDNNDAAAFVTTVAATRDNWIAFDAAAGESGTGPLGSDPEQTLKRKRTVIAKSAERVVALARENNLPNGGKFTLKSVTSNMAGGSRSYTSAGRKLTVPWVHSATIVVEAQFATRPDANGEYVLQIGDVIKLPAGWKIDSGIRWSRMPTGVANEDTARTLAMIDAIESGLFLTPRPLTGVDDPELTHFGETVATLVRGGDVAQFVKTATLTRKETRQLFAEHQWGDASRADTAFGRANKEAGTGATALLQQLEQLGVPLTGADIDVSQVLVEYAQTSDFGSIEGARGRSLQVTLDVRSPAKAKNGKPLAGAYTVFIERPLRAFGRWTLNEGSMRWQSFPSGLITDDERQRIELENHLSKFGVFPSGFELPDIELTRLSDASKLKLSALRGKLVILDFWAVWCGPCQQPMAELQKLCAAHPEWKGKVEVITVSIDTEAKEAADHLAKNQWDKTDNLWAGKGGWQSSPATAFRVRSVPTSYVISRDGRVLQAGHPGSLNLEQIITRNLK